MGDEPAEAGYSVNANLFPYIWNPPKPWSKSKEDPGVLTWTMVYNRGPNCDEDDGNHEDSETFFRARSKEAISHGYNSNYEYCCAEKAAGCFANSTCPSLCTRNIVSRTRMTSPEVGFYIKWKIDDDGMPFGCDCFEQDSIGEKQSLGVCNCPKQDLSDGFNMPLWQRVEDYADHQEKWLEDLSHSFLHMQTNGYDPKELRDGPEDFWRFDCCIGVLANFDDTGAIKKFFGIKSALNCQAKCQAEESCVEFGYDSQRFRCFLFDNVVTRKSTGLYYKMKFIGSKSCTNMSNCQAYKLYQ